MERQLFTWENWEGDTGQIMQFETCTLLKPIAELPVGTIVPMIVVDFDNGTLHLCNMDGEAWYACRLVLGIGGRLDLE